MLSTLTRAFAVAVLLLPLISTSAFGQQPGVREPLSTVAQQYLDGQRRIVQELTQRNLGRSFSGNTTRDIALLQEILDRKLVDRKDRATLQAMGVILGDILAKEEGLRWVFWTDRNGRAKALEIPGKEDVVFPVTGIARRYEAGADVEVERVYGLLKDSVRHIRSKIYIR